MNPSLRKVGHLFNSLRAVFFYLKWGGPVEFLQGGGGEDCMDIRIKGLKRWQPKQQ